jgi:glyceraldehyde-3-phosphate dehydrogenase/erythrose-4-phosphate dehydrogenase
MATTFASVQNGIVFLIAEWSGPAKLACNDLKCFLEHHRSALDNLTCVDVDHEPEIYDLPELSGKIHGWGEVVVIKNGKIVFVTVLGKDKDQIQNRCEALLRIYKA